MCQPKMHPCRVCGTLCEVKIQNICGKLLPQITCPQPVEICYLGGTTLTIGHRYQTMDIAKYQRDQQQLVAKS